MREKHANVLIGLICALVFFFVSCRKNSVLSVAADVYVTGSITSRAVYWKNGVPRVLGPAGTVNGMSIYNGSVYVAGNQYANNLSAINGIYWRNGIATPLPTGTFINGIFVSGGDVYLAGTQDSVVNTGSTISYVTNGAVWKNGKTTSLGPNSIGYSVVVQP